MASGHRFFLDRDLGGRQVASGLRASGWDVVTANERYTPAVAEGLADPDWIRDVAAEFVAISSDHSIGKRAIQTEAIRLTSARILIVSANATAEDQTKLLLDHAAPIFRLIDRREGPWVYGVRADGLRSIHLLRI